MIGDNFGFEISLPSNEIIEATLIANQKEREGIMEQFYAESLFSEEYTKESWRELIKTN